MPRETARLRQTLDLAGYTFEEGDTLNFTLHYCTKGKNTPRLKLKLLIFYSDIPVTVNSTAKTRAKSYALFGASVYAFGADAASVTGMKVIIHNTKPVAEKVFIDNVSLIFNPADGDPTE